MIVRTHHLDDIISLRGDQTPSARGSATFGPRGAGGSNRAWGFVPKTGRSQTGRRAGRIGNIHTL